MPKQYKLKQIAHALRMGINLAYGRKLRRRKRQELFEMLDDMSLALTAEATTDSNRRLEYFSWVLGELSDCLDIPVELGRIPLSRRKK